MLVLDLEMLQSAEMTCSLTALGPPVQLLSISAYASLVERSLKKRNYAAPSLSDADARARDRSDSELGLAQWRAVK